MQSLTLVWKMFEILCYLVKRVLSRVDMCIDSEELLERIRSVDMLNIYTTHTSLLVDIYSMKDIFTVERRGGRYIVCIRDFSRLEKCAEEGRRLYLKYLQDVLKDITNS